MIFSCWAFLDGLVGEEEDDGDGQGVAAPRQVSVVVL